MNFVTSTFWRTPSSQPQTEPAAAPTVRVAVEENREIYSRTEKGWKNYEIKFLSEAQCEFVHKDCLADASYERNQAIAETIGAVLLTVGMVVSAVVVAKLASLFFIVAMIKIAGPISPLAIFATKTVVHLCTYIGAGSLFEKLIPACYGSIKDHWEAAKHYDDLRSKAIVRQIGLKFAPMPAPAPIETPPPPVEEELLHE
jgi:hypothetical protein